MQYISQHIQTVITTYRGEIPLSHYLKNYFKQYPILGSRDRKIIGGLVYAWYRCSHAIQDNAWFDTLKEQWLREPKKFGGFELVKWLSEQHIFCGTDRLFPYNTGLSEGIAKASWLESMLEQPNLFIRIRKNREEITNSLKAHAIPFTFISDTCLSLPNSAKIDSMLRPSDYVVQDASSQHTGAFFSPHASERWYDCCCGAGGKSLLLKDLEPTVHLTVSDVRKSIIRNLNERFNQYGYPLPISYVADVADNEVIDAVLGGQRFNNIICDVPCTGSGTWARTPEQLYFFKDSLPSSFPVRQKAIAINASRYLEPGGRLIYITCSVFKNENEEVVDEVCRQTGLRPIRQSVINGIAIKADSMFVAELQSPS